ncbi:GNAT family N-acetyltransferase [Microlunatus panaciterrae]|uniref:Acetyltransferase n=1 Tax=Microlunatus panaciterrae TaxID=400768 RepID=A0ABS2REQ2_9ACTN|nr:GNAT family N-acetyltransferase [Microlunatus panaciterrae]MBM7797471.1 putative acetyltransferase [Microlunatus panaciterrae]
MTEVSLRRFSAGCNPDGSADAQTLAWLQSKALGFLADPPSPEHAARTVESFRQDARVLTAIHDHSAHPPGWGPDRPVATYATLRKSLNVGAGRTVPAQLVADVTVLPTHRGQGLLRRMVLEDLRQAAADGVPVAALYAADAGLYGRYGFGPATRTLQVEVDVRRVTFTSPPTGTVAVADPDVLCELVPLVYDEFHRATIGSVQRLWSHAPKVCGLWAEDAPDRDPAVRGAVHFGENGDPDGYVTFKFLGWQQRPLKIEIVDIVALSTDAHLGLWGFLTSHTQADLIRHGHLAPDDPLPWALTDRRAVRVVGEQDGLWLRVLDPEVCLRERLQDVTGDPITLRVRDELEFCDGAYRIVPGGDGVQVTRVDPDGPVDATLDVSALASAFLGGYPAATLERAGRIQCTSPAVAARLGLLFGSIRAPYNDTHF